MIKNSEVVNESVDLQTLVKRLREENLRLKEELKLLNEGENANANKVIQLTDAESIAQIVREYIANTDDDAILSVGSYWKLQYAIKLMKKMILEGKTVIH